MKVAFFGAGASYGSSNENTPPLGPNLFSALQRWDPGGWGSLSDPWPTRFSNDFEQAMAELISAGVFAAPLQWAMAGYFLKNFPIAQTNLYIRFLQDVAQSEQNIALASINYDTLLFQADTHSGVKLEIGLTERTGNKLALCLPHGSSVLKCEGVRGSGGVSFTGGVSTSGKITIFKDATEFDQESATNVFPPVMSYFEPNKFTVSCANFIADQRQLFADLIARASKVAIIGVKVHPTDTHIWEPIRQTSATCFYLSGPAGADEYYLWSQNANRNTDIICAQYFADGYNEMINFLVS